MKFNTFFNKFVPKGENEFYPILNKISENLLQCSILFVNLATTSDKDQHKNLYKQIKTMETHGDALLETLFDELNSTFITPFDREDINALGERLDDVLDGINSAAKRIVMYQPKILPEQAGILASILKTACEHVCTAVNSLESMKKSPQAVKATCAQLHEVEKEADDVYELFITTIFEQEQNAIELIKLKEIMQEVERATDKADLVGKIIKTIVVKYA